MQPELERLLRTQLFKNLPQYLKLESQDEQCLQRFVDEASVEVELVADVVVAYEHLRTNPLGFSRLQPHLQLMLSAMMMQSLTTLLRQFAEKERDKELTKNDAE